MTVDALHPAHGPEAIAADIPAVRYDLNDAELDAVETDMVALLRDRTPEGTVFGTILIEGDHPAANFGRTYEQRTFEYENYDFDTAMSPYEGHSYFLYTLDLEYGVIAHTKRIVMARSPEEFAETGRTGLEMVDDRLFASDPEESAELDSLLRANGIAAPQACFNIATNQDTRRAPFSRERMYGMFSYKTVFELTRQLHIDHVLAYLNPVAKRSLGHLGLQAELLGKQEYHLPRSDGEGYDDRYLAVCIGASAHNIAVFTDPEADIQAGVADAKVKEQIRQGIARQVIPRVMLMTPDISPVADLQP